MIQGARGTMNAQSITQTITVFVDSEGELASTGLSIAPYIIGGMLLLTCSILIYYFAFHHSRRRTRASFRGFSIIALLAIVGVSLALHPLTASAAPMLTLKADQNEQTIIIPKGGGVARLATTLTSGSVNTTGYTLAATLAQPEPGIALTLKGGDLSQDTLLTPGATPTIKTTNNVSSDDVTDLTLTFTVDDTVTSGKKTIALSYTATDNEPAAPTTMQTFTQAQCSALPTYTGSNDEALRSLTDSRGGTTRTYRIAKLADGNCWMVDNLKLGSTSGTITLTPTDTNIATNFTLPQLYAGTDSAYRSYDTPFTYGPVPGDTGAGITNYGYLYNWPAATAGETQTSMPAGSGNAPHDICPASWRLPTGGRDGAGEFAMLNAKMNNPSATAGSASSGTGYYQNWQNNGPFKGIFAGYWWDGFQGADGYGGWWSRSAYPDDSSGAFGAGVNADGVYPDGDSERGYGSSVRCLLK